MYNYKYGFVIRLRTVTQRRRNFNKICYLSFSTFLYIPRILRWFLNYAIGDDFYVLSAEFERSQEQNGRESDVRIYKVWNVTAKREDIFGKGGAASGNNILHRHRKKLLQTLTHFCKGRQEYEPFLTIQVAQNVFRRKEHVIDDVWEGSPSFRNCGTIKNEVRDVIDGD